MTPDGFEDWAISELNLDEDDVEAMKTRTRRYARRQLTWMRKLPSVHTLDVTGMDDGIWYYNPVKDEYSLLNRGDYRKQAAFISLEQGFAGEGFAT